MDPLSQQRFLQERKAAKRKAFLQHQAASKALKAAAGAAARQSAPAPAPIAQPAQPIAYALGCAVVRVAREAGTRQSFVSLSKLGFKLRKDEAVRQALPNSKLGEYLSTSLPARDFNVTLTGKTPGVLVRKHAWQKYSSTPANVPADGAPVLHESAPLQSTLQPPDGGFAETPATGLPEPSRFAPHPTHPQPHQLSQYSLAPQSTLGAPVQEDHGQAYGGDYPQVQLITTLEAADGAVSQLLQHGHLALDCKGVELSRHGRLCLVQIATPDCCFVFDLITPPHDELERILDRLRRVLEDDQIEKAVHDARQDSAALKYQANINLVGVFDTQIAHSMLAMLQASESTPTDSCQTPRIALNELLALHGLPTNQGKKGIKAAMAGNKAFWAQRPLMQQAVEYASQDVLHLVELAKQQRSKLVESTANMLYTLSRKSSQLTWDTNDRSERSAGQDATVHAKELKVNAVTSQISLVPWEDRTESSVEAFPAPDETARRSQQEGEVRLRECADPLYDLDVISFLRLLPPGLEKGLSRYLNGLQRGSDGQYPVLIEVTIDHGRGAMARFADGVQAEIATAEPSLLLTALLKLAAIRNSGVELHANMDFNFLFNARNRMGMDATLHRISAVRGAERQILGLTYRLGRDVEGVARVLQDKMQHMWARPPQQPGGFLWAQDGSDSLHEATPSLLILGPPGRGKTTLLRGIARFAADPAGCAPIIRARLSKRVVVVDGTSEIGGDSDKPHSCIGNARRMPIPGDRTQAQVAMEALQNHMAEMIVIDELACKEDVASCRRISQQGVSLVATCHGVSLRSLIRNPDLNQLLGGLSTVTLGDKHAHMTYRDIKTRTERAGPPAFTTIVEMVTPAALRIYNQAGQAVDALLRGEAPCSELRTRCQDGRIKVQYERPAAGGSMGAGSSILGTLIASILGRQ